MQGKASRYTLQPQQYKEVADMPSAQPLSSFAVPASGTSGATAPSSGVRTWIVMGDLHDKAARLGEIQGAFVAILLNCLLPRDEK